MTITDVRVRKITKEGKMKAVVSITLDDEFVVHDIKVIEGEKGLFIAMPSKKGNDGEYRDIAHPISATTENGTIENVGEYFVDETGLPLAPYSGIQGLHVLKVQASQKKDAIVKVLQTLMQPEVSVKLAKVSGCAPAVESCYTLEEVTSDPLIMAMKQTAETAIPMPNIPEMDVMWTVAGNLLVSVNMSGQDIEPASAAAQKKALELIEAMK